MTTYQAQRGLTLIEVLIALAIIAIAMTAVIKASTESIRATDYLNSKTMAAWVGLSVLNEARIAKQPEAQEERIVTTLLDRKWYWQLIKTPTANKQIDKWTVQVFEHEQDEVPRMTLESYFYREKQ